MGEYARKVRKSELERSLLIIVEINRLNKELMQVVNERNEILQQKYECREKIQKKGIDNKEKESIERTYKELEQRGTEISNQEAIVGEKISELVKLISDLSDFIFGKEKDIRMELDNDEIQMQFVEEYFYLIYYENVGWDILFKNPADFILTACLQLGEAKRDFLIKALENFHYKK